ncbi:hypothetical protein HGG76_21425 [Ochrobactrum tritici]|uniref:Delta-aminolevulinic acid dehydratase n=1 Tax=Brucella tritici TaxID=94626 RepID=A0A7X6FS33_9HYPH|nr:hypothetical protein [Brucella tritici]
MRSAGCLPHRHSEAPRRQGSDAFSANGVIVQAAKRMKDAVGDRLVIIGDSYMGYFTDHMIGGVLDSDNRILDKETLDSVARTAVAWGKAGVDILCCSTMVDGRVGAAREALDAENLDDMLLMSSIKYNSAFFKAGTGTTATGASYGFDKRCFTLSRITPRMRCASWKPTWLRVRK